MNLQVIKNRIQKTLAYTFAGLLFLLIATFLILQMPPVQNAIVGKLLRNFSKVSGFTTRIESFRLLWFDRLELGGVSITDPEGNQMIGLQNILINFDLSELLNQRDVNIDGVVLNGASVYLTRMHESDTSSALNINIFVSELNKLSRAEGDGKNPTINIGEAVLNGSKFTYIDQNRDTIRSGFDYNHFILDVDEAQVQNFLVLGDTVQFDVVTLLLQDQKTKFNIHQLSTFFRISQSSMEFTNLHLKAGQSFIADSVIFTYGSQLDLQTFVDKVKIHASLDKTIIHPDDLALFAPGTEKIGKPIHLTGKADGRVRKFNVKEMDATIGNTRLIGSLEMDGLPEIQETFILLNLRNSNLEFDDLDFLFNEPTLTRLRPFGRLAMNGQFLGYPSDFVAHGDFNSKLGRLVSDINLKVNDVDVDKSSYAGKLKMVNFDIGRYLQDTILFQKVTLDGNLRGSGLTTETANFTLNGMISSLGFNGYNYTNIATNAVFASEFFNGSLTIDDPNLKFSAKGSIDLRDKRNVIKIVANLDTALLHELNLSSKNIFVRTNLDVDIKGLELDSLVGTADFSDFYITYDDGAMFLQRIHLNAEKHGINRFVNLETTLFDALIEGNYLFSDLTNDLNRMVHEMALQIKNEEVRLEEYYRERKRKPKNYQASFTINIKDIKPISDLLKIDVGASGAKIQGSFTSGYTTILRAYTSLDSLRLQENLFLNTEAEISVSKIADSTNILALAFVNSQKQILKSRLNSENLVIEGIWNKSRIDFEFDCDQSAQGNYVRLKGNVDFMPDSTRIKLLPSTIHLLERDWHFNPANEIIVRNHEWDFRDLEIQNQQQSISAVGQLSEDPSKILTFRVMNLDLTILNVISDKKFSGRLNAEVLVDNFYREPSIQNVVFIDSLTINNFLVGSINGKNIWNKEDDKFDINLFIDRLGNRIVNLQGDYMPAREDPLFITAILEKANVKIIEPFLEDIFSTMDGTVSGSFRITGKLNDPLINGEGQVSDGLIVVAYTKTLYHFTGIVGLGPTSIYFKDIDMTDAFRNKGRLNGSITHRNFNDMRINVDATFRNFQVLNTTARDNSLFYGQGYATGDVRFSGPVSNLRISSNAKTEKNTRLYIPIGGTSSTEKEEFINFVTFNDSSAVETALHKFSNRINLTGITFDLNLEVTPDAYAEIIFDLKSGDIIRGRGTGDLKLQLDTKGEFNMFGTVQFTEGWYNFTLYDIINKEFQIQRGSRITWHGDPYAATLNIFANYNQLASFGPLVNDPAAANSPELKRKYPVQVLLKLDGPMLSPNITFDITANDLPRSVFVANGMSLDFLFESFKNRLDEQELKRQVFSLIVLRKFSPPESFNTSGTLYNSVSELFSNQLSYWMSQVDDNLEIDVDLGTMDQEAFNTFQLRLSYTFLNGRLRITRDGMIGNTDYRSNVNNQGNMNSVAGDWTVDYFLTGDGKFKVKMYNRTNYNQLATSLNNQSYFTTGVSLQHVQSFNEFKDLVRSTRKNKATENEDQKNLKPSNEAIREEDGGR